MKKIALALILFLLSGSYAYAASPDGRTDKGVLAREGIVLGRGLLNVLGTFVEIIATPAREHRIHSKVWPITGILRMPTNVAARAASAANDIAVYPFVVPFTDDLTPLTEPMGLPEYAWDFSE